MSVVSRAHCPAPCRRRALPSARPPHLGLSGASGQAWISDELKQTEPRSDFGLNA